MAARRPSDPTGDDESPAPRDPRDVVFVYGQDDSGDYGVIRKRDAQLELGRLRTVKEGQPLHGELIHLRPREEHAQLFDVEVLHDARPEAERAGPPIVASRAYRDGWDRVFGATPTKPSGFEN